MESTQSRSTGGQAVKKLEQPMRRALPVCIGGIALEIACVGLFITKPASFIESFPDICPDILGFGKLGKGIL
jgi:hypothetical protein